MVQVYKQLFNQIIQNFEDVINGIQILGFIQKHEGPLFFLFFNNQVNLMKQNPMVWWNHESILYVPYLLLAKTYYSISQDKVPYVADEG